jgi:hypothetical protein
MIGNNNIIDLTNGNLSTVGNNIATDKSFLMVGDNGAVPKWSATGAPAGQNIILSRIWKVQETGTIGSVKLSFYSGKAGTPTVIPNASAADVKLNLYISPDAVFNDNNNTVVALTFDGKYWNANVDLTNGQFFTLVKDIDGPGCIDVGPVLWFKANQPGATPTTVWEDQSGNAGDVTAPTGVTFTAPTSLSSGLPY